MTGGLEQNVLTILRERHLFDIAARTHDRWSTNLEAKYPKGPRGGLSSIVRSARKMQDRIASFGPEALVDDLLPRFVYAAERWKQITDPDVSIEFPYLRYVHIDPTGPSPPNRATHQAQHGKIYEISHPFWDIWYPLNGLGCMCTVMSVSERDLARHKGDPAWKLGESRGWSISENRRFEFSTPDEGFDFNIGKVLS